MIGRGCQAHVEEDLDGDTFPMQRHYVDLLGGATCPRIISVSATNLKLPE